MKATTIIISFLFALVTTIDAVDINKQVLDYATGNPIPIQRRCLIRAFWKGERHYVDRVNFPYVGLRLEPRPSHFLRLEPRSNKDGSTDQKGPFLTSYTRYGIRFNDFLSFWKMEFTGRIEGMGLMQPFKEVIVIKETEENRVYKLVYEGNTGSYDIGVEVMYMGNKEERYYLAVMRTPLPSLHDLRFTFELY